MSSQSVALPKLFVALDDSSLEGVLGKLELIVDVPGDWGAKVNLDAMAIAGIETAVKAVCEASGRPVFADMKPLNGARTMLEMFKAAAAGGACMSNICLPNAMALLEKAAEGARKAGIVLFGLGPTTHMTETDCFAIYGRSFEETTVRLGGIARQTGLDGFICPGTMNAVALELGLTLLNPGVRPPWFEDKKANDQEQTVTPTIAFQTGGTIVVCGSPILKSSVPAEALVRILAEIEAAVASLR